MSSGRAKLDTEKLEDAITLYNDLYILTSDENYKDVKERLQTLLNDYDPWSTTNQEIEEANQINIVQLEQTLNLFLREKLNAATKLLEKLHDEYLHGYFSNPKNFHFQQETYNDFKERLQVLTNETNVEILESHLTSLNDVIEVLEEIDEECQQEIKKNIETQLTTSRLRATAKEFAEILAKLSVKGSVDETGYRKLSEEITGNLHQHSAYNNNNQLINLINDLTSQIQSKAKKYLQLPDLPDSYFNDPKNHHLLINELKKELQKPKVTIHFGAKEKSKAKSDQKVTDDEINELKSREELAKLYTNAAKFYHNESLKKTPTTLPKSWRAMHDNCLKSLSDMHTTARYELDYKIDQVKSEFLTAQNQIPYFKEKKDLLETNYQSIRDYLTELSQLDEPNKGKYEHRMREIQIKLNDIKTEKLFLNLSSSKELGDMVAESEIDMDELFQETADLTQKQTQSSSPKKPSYLAQVSVANTQDNASSDPQKKQSPTPVVTPKSKNNP